MYRQEITEQTQAMYLKSLNDLPIALMERTFSQVIRQCKFYPTVAEILEEASRVQCQMQNERDALRQGKTRLIEDKTKADRHDGKTREELKAEFEQMLRESKLKSIS